MTSFWPPMYIPHCATPDGTMVCVSNVVLVWRNLNSQGWAVSQKSFGAVAWKTAGIVSGQIHACVSRSSTFPFRQSIR
jgi:hypothetical protein